MRDLLETGCDVLPLTQYLRPSALDHPVERWAPPEELVELRDFAEGLGIAGVMPGPLVRSLKVPGRYGSRG